MSWTRCACAMVTAVLLAATISCSRASREEAEETIRITGSDTMVNLTVAWVEAFNIDHPTKIIIRGGGSGVGIANLCSGRIELATSSRPLKPKEIETAKANTGRP